LQLIKSFYETDQAQYLSETESKTNKKATVTASLRYLLTVLQFSVKDLNSKKLRSI